MWCGQGTLWSRVASRMSLFITVVWIAVGRRQHYSGRTLSRPQTRDLTWQSNEEATGRWMHSSVHARLLSPGFCVTLPLGCSPVITNPPDIRRNATSTSPRRPELQPVDVIASEQHRRTVLRRTWPILASVERGTNKTLRMLPPGVCGQYHEY